jgi:hypothetical protein
MTMAPTIEPWPYYNTLGTWGWTYPFGSTTAAARTNPAPPPPHRKTRKPGNARRKVIARRRTNRIARRLLDESE